MCSAMPSPLDHHVAELLAKAREIADVARQRAQQTEADRRVSADMVARMRQADLMRIMQPQAYGGFEYGFEVFAHGRLATGAGRAEGDAQRGMVPFARWNVSPLALTTSAYRSRSHLAAAGPVDRRPDSCRASGRHSAVGGTPGSPYGAFTRQHTVHGGSPRSAWTSSPLSPSSPQRSSTGRPRVRPRPDRSDQREARQRRSNGRRQERGAMRARMASGPQDPGS